MSITLDPLGYIRVDYGDIERDVAAVISLRSAFSMEDVPAKEELSPSSVLVMINNANTLATKQTEKKYLSNPDLIEVFLNEQCVLDPEAIIQCSHLYRAFKLWCIDSGDMYISQRKFTPLLGDKGLLKSDKSTRGVYYYQGVRLKTERNYLTR